MGGILFRAQLFPPGMGEWLQISERYRLYRRFSCGNLDLAASFSRDPNNIDPEALADLNPAKMGKIAIGFSRRDVLSLFWRISRMTVSRPGPPGRLILHGPNFSDHKRNRPIRGQSD